MKLIDMYEAWDLIAAGKIIAYPTESCYGLGCDPFNETAMTQLLSLKNRQWQKGFIVLINHWAQLEPLISPTTETLLQPVKLTWPGPVTWLFPKSSIIPEWLCGKHDTLAIRMSAHPVAREICAKGPVVSTSANKTDYAPAKTLEALNAQFPAGIAACVEGSIGDALQPSEIIDFITRKKYR